MSNRRRRRQARARRQANNLPSNRRLLERELYLRTLSRVSGGEFERRRAALRFPSLNKFARGYIRNTRKDLRQQSIVRVVKRPIIGRTLLLRRPYLQFPYAVAICVRRSVRRQVLIALKRAMGKGNRAEFTRDSEMRC